MPVAESKNRIISRNRRRDELEAQHVPIGLRLRPNDLRVLDGLVVRCGANSERADVIDWHARVHRDSKTTDARVDGQARAACRSEEVDFGIERPTPALTARATMNGGVGAALREDRRQSVGNGCQSIANVSKRPILG